MTVTSIRQTSVLSVSHSIDYIIALSYFRFREVHINKIISVSGFSFSRKGTRLRAIIPLPFHGKCDFRK